MAKVRKAPVNMALTGAAMYGKAAQLGADNLFWGFKRCVQGFIKGWVGKHEGVQGIAMVLPQKQKLSCRNKV